MGALGEGFTAKLGDTTKANLKRDAATLDETAWDTRLKEVEELVAVKRDAEEGRLRRRRRRQGRRQRRQRRQGSTFKPEELARLGTGLNGGGATASSEPTPVAPPVGRQGPRQGARQELTAASDRTRRTSVTR
jgi:hypothetical protein